MLHRQNSGVVQGKKVFTTGEAADICKVSQQTIIRSFDSGRLKGFKVPGSRFRRIPLDSLVAYMKEHSIPDDNLLAFMGKPKVLAVGFEAELVHSLAAKKEEHGWEIAAVQPELVLLELDRQFPAILVMTQAVAVGDQPRKALFTFIAGDERLRKTKVAIIADSLDDQSLLKEELGKFVLLPAIPVYTKLSGPGIIRAIEEAASLA